jgi:FkbM family methyltransferase
VTTSFAETGTNASRLTKVGEFLRETHGQSRWVTAEVYCNKLLYGLIRTLGKTPASGWVSSPVHWHRFPFSLRGRVLWSPFLNAWFSPEDESAIEYMLRLPRYEPLEWVAPTEGQVFLDIGAYVGPYSIRAARAVGPTGRVIALEPDATNRRQLEKNLALNGITNCTVAPFAAWSRPGRVRWRPGSEPVWHRVDEAAGPGEIEATTVDEVVSRMALPCVDWIKIDIEGAELEALQGAAATIKRFHPLLFIEEHAVMQSLRDLLAQFNYEIASVVFDEPAEHHGWVLARFSAATPPVSTPSCGRA